MIPTTEDSGASLGGGGFPLLMICTARGLWRLVMNVLELFYFVYSCITLFSFLHNIKPTSCSYVIYMTHPFFVASE
ncbi:hypothetical protein BJX68DRAFT_70220 [Aspergillus pseudodeflectus]|uniref:Uncharacterized protein n=1 Tax=Aspergillus pseudodeflectus TaxID=176178 RepID=A0ABR4KGA1_9EURO